MIIDIPVHTVIISVWTVFYMKKVFRKVIVSAVIAALAWIFTSVRYTDIALLPHAVREYWADVSDMGLAREYIREKSTVIQRIIEKTYRSFGPNG